MRTEYLKPADYGLTNDVLGAYAFLAINYAVREAKENKWMAKHDKLFFVYQVMKRYKDANALNEKAMDAIEAQIAM